MSQPITWMALVVAPVTFNCGDAYIPDDGLTPQERDSLTEEFERAPSLADTPSAIGHFHPGRQASTHLSGPLSPNAEVQLRWLEAESGIDVGASPWHVISPRTYGEDTRTLWGAGLTHAYKFALDDDFRFIDTFEVNARATSLIWNLVALADGRVVIPDPNGYLGGEGGPACRTSGPTYVVMDDDPTDLDSPIGCGQVFELDEATARSVCGVSGGQFDDALSATDLTPMFTGEFAAKLIFEDAGGFTTYLAILDEGLTGVLDCALLDDGLITNAMPTEPLDATTTALYAVNESALVKMAYDGASQTLARVYERPVPVRFRTGTTPTLVNTSDGERLVVFIDARCAVGSVLNGLILCDDDPSPSQLVAVRREDTPAAPVVIATDLPDAIDTVENSPSARGDVMVVANYSGYLPNGLKVPAGGVQPTGGPQTWMESPDAVAEFATGIAALQWDPDADRFEVLWVDEDRQVNSVTTISGGANMVYGSGAEQGTGKSYLYGFRLVDDADGPAGEELLRVELADAPFRTTRTDARGNVVFALTDYGYGVGEFFDQGNNILIDDDRSAIISGGSGLARVRDPQ